MSVLIPICSSGPTVQDTPETSKIQSRVVKSLDNPHRLVTFTHSCISTSWLLCSMSSYRLDAYKTGQENEITHLSLTFEFLLYCHWTSVINLGQWIFILKEVGPRQQLLPYCGGRKSRQGFQVLGQCGFHYMMAFSQCVQLSPPNLLKLLTREGEMLLTKKTIIKAK